MTICSLSFSEVLEELHTGFLPAFDNFTLFLDFLPFLPLLLVCMDALAFEVVETASFLLDARNGIASSDAYTP